MEDIETYPIAFTITVNPKWYCQKNISYKMQYKESLEYITRTFGESCDMLIYPECMLNGNIHYHGFIKVKDGAGYFKAIHTLKKNLGFIKVKLIDDVPGWVKYCEKSVATMKKLLDVKVLPYIHGGI